MKYIFAAIIFSNAMLILLPAILFGLPIAQTDGASHYVFAKMYVKHWTLDVENPQYNRLGTVENRVSETPPFTPIFFGTLLNIFESDIFFINGGLGVLFFLMSSVFFYFTVKELTGNTTVSVISMLFFILNLRAYYTLFTGIYPAFIAFCFTMPSLYFTLKFLKQRKTNDALLAAAFVFLTAMTYPVQAAFLVLLQTALWAGFVCERAVKIRFPRAVLVIKRTGVKDFKALAKIVLPSAAIFLIALFSFTITSQTTTRVSWISEWLRNLTSNCIGYPCVWNNFAITDGPLIVIFAVLGSIYLFLRNDWKSMFPVLGGLLIILLPVLFASGNPFIIIFIQRFYTTFFVLMIIPASILIYKFISSRHLKTIGLVIISAIFLIQVAKLGFFYAQISPAISEDEFAASQELFNYRQTNILYVNNDVEWSTFRAFKWILVFAQSENYEITDEIPGNLDDFDYIFIKNVKNLDDRETELVNSRQIIFDKGVARIYRVV